MFAPMTPQTEFAHFEAETRERAIRAENLMQVQINPGAGFINEIVHRFTEWAFERRQTAEPQIVTDLTAQPSPECC